MDLPCLPVEHKLQINADAALSPCETSQCLWYQVACVFVGCVSLRCRSVAKKEATC